ncbi:MAG: sulfotransferase [Pseudomonadota bacterium]
MSALDEKRIVLIAGQPKAGTTSLFDWLSQHPQIGAGKLKELRFFLDPGYPLDAPLRFEGDNLAEYLTLFQNAERPVLLDASPDYIGCNAPLELPAIHPDSKAILLFREPVDRMMSAYRFYRSLGHVPAEMTFDAYIEKQHADGVGPHTRSEFRALDHCRKGYHVARWRAAFGDNLLVLDFAQLRDAPEETLQEVCRFIEVDENAAIELSHANKTRGNRAPGLFRIYAELRRSFAQATLASPWVYRALQPLGRLVSRSFQSSTSNSPAIEVSQRSLDIIRQLEGAH